MTGWADMRHDLVPLGGFDEESLRYKFSMWFIHYWWPTRRWMPKVWLWWGHTVMRYPKPPPFAMDRVAQHFGWVEGVEGCVDSPCAKHGWEVP